ncbi:hypothetical protein HAHE_16450 [Haloferula helveola]|uniref:Holin-X, holin superfamily III n=1 Tax=Haloferula helveola TaxID=490095 RepID=A0ABM7REG3_9BACT|nr:hypothetical protein HAHE_16450 [Haloferula helveola]
MTDGENLLLRLISDSKEAAPTLGKALQPHMRKLLMLGFGVVVAIGSTGLLLGALTTALASLVMQFGVPMVPAMNVGFFTVGILSLGIGLWLAKANAGAIRRALASASEGSKGGR